MNRRTAALLTLAITRAHLPGLRPGIALRRYLSALALLARFGR